MRSSHASRKKAKEKLVHVGIKVPPEVKEKWEALAEENGRSISEWCLRQIEKAIHQYHLTEPEQGISSPQVRDSLSSLEHSDMRPYSRDL